MEKYNKNRKRFRSRSREKQERFRDFPRQKQNFYRNVKKNEANLDDDLDDYWARKPGNKKSPKTSENEESSNENIKNTDFPDYYQLELPKDFSLDEISFEIKTRETLPEINESYVDIEKTNKLNELKKDITPIVTKWESIIKFLISDYELIDIYRNENVLQKKYEKSIIDYDRIDQVFSRAYFKLWEILTTNKMLAKFEKKPIKIACLAEGPGGFINCLIDYRNYQNRARKWTDDEFFSITRKIKGDMQALDWDYFRAKKYFAMKNKQGYKNIKLSYGIDDGDILNINNIRFFISNDLQNKKCELVTGDGGIDLKSDEQYSLQELYNAKLFFAEVYMALAIQEIGGVFILKIYDSLYDVTINILMLLTQFYEKVVITKPHTSRPASSERYLVCSDFKGISAELLKKLENILINWVEIEPVSDYQDNKYFVESFLKFKENENSDFKENLRTSNENCIEHQIEMIDQGHDIYRKYGEGEIDAKFILERKKKQFEIALKWCKQHKIDCFKSMKFKEEFN